MLRVRDQVGRGRIPGTWERVLGKGAGAAAEEAAFLFRDSDMIGVGTARGSARVLNHEAHSRTGANATAIRV